MFSIKHLMRRANPIALVLFLLVWQLAFAAVPLIKSQKASAAPICTIDTAGANDEPGQKDLNKLCVDYSGVPSTVATTWNWDETGTSGANTMDACNLFDTNGDGNINYAVCVSTTNDPADLQGFITYSCGDAKIDRCTSPTTPVSSGTTVCSVSQVTNDPFPGPPNSAQGDSYPKDTQGACTVQLSTVGGASAKLIDVCSYPSEQPNSDPSDCVIARPKAGKLEVIKNLVPSSDTGKFNLQIDGTTKATDVGNNGTTGEVVVPEGAHSVGELAGTGTSLAGYASTISCKDLNGTGSVIASGTGTTLSNINVLDGSDIVCIITNTASGSITITKDAIANSLQDFSFAAIGTGVSNFSLDDDSGVSGADNTLSNSKQFSGLTAGSYTFTENATSGWDLSAITCSQGATVQKTSTSVTITLSAGQNVNCTFENRQRGNILVHKQTNPDGDPAQFSITASGTGNIAGTATRSITDNATVTYDVAQGTYAVSEASQGGWTQTSNNCTNLVINGNTPKVNGVPTLECTIVNTKYATLTIVKDALPNDPQDFGFTTTGGLTPSSFSLDDDSDATLSNQQVFSSLLPGTYSVTESATSNWALTGLSCAGTSDYTRPNNGSMVSVNIAAGQNVTCTFTNTKLGSISGIKYTANADASLGAVLSGWTIFIDLNGNKQWDAGEPKQVTDVSGSYSFIGLLPGEYALAEILTNGWTQIFSPSAVTLSAGQTSTGNNFGNFQNATISGYKFNDVNGDHTENNGTDPKLSNWTINLKNAQNQTIGSTTTNGSGVYSFTNLAPGTYNVCEVQQSGWVQTYPLNNLCHSVVIDISGETEHANFGNQGRGTVRVIKNVDTDGDGTVDQQDVTNWNWNINSTGNYATGSANGQSVAAGSYTISELQKLNYHVTASSCSGETAPQLPSESLSATVSPGETVTCTFTNTRDTGTLIVKKHVVNDNGGTASADDFTVHVKQGGVDVTGSPSAGSESGTSYTVTTGTYTVSENTPLAGYTQTSIVCDGNETANVDVTTGTSKTCIITNDDNKPSLTLVKEVVNDNSGEASASEWTLHAEGPTSFSGTTGVTSGATFSQGTYALSETDGPADYTAGDWKCTNDVTVTEGNITLGLGDSTTCTIVNNDNPHPGIHVVKSGPATAHEGDTVTYTFTVTNTGDTVLDNVTVNDNIAGVGNYQSGDINNDGLMQKSEVWVYTKEYKIPTDQTANVVNTVTVCATDPDKTQVCDTDKHCLDVLHPSITVEKSGPAESYEDVMVKYNFKVTNTGDTTLYDVTVGDDIASAETCPKTSLAPGESMDCSATYLIPSPSINDILNTVNACGYDSLKKEVCNDDSHTLDVLHPAIHVVKSGPDTAHEGDTVTYTFTVTNTGDVALSNTTVEDDIAGPATYISGDTNSDGKLDTTETWIYNVDYKIPADQIDDVVNTVKACGDGPTVQDYSSDPTTPVTPNVCDDDSHTLDVLHPEIKVVKSGPTTAHEGDKVTYTFTVTNTGDTPLSGITVSDNIAGNGVYQSGDVNNNDILEQDETWIYTADYIIPTPQTTDVKNTVTVCGLESVFIERDIEDSYWDWSYDSQFPVEQPQERTKVCDDDSHTLIVEHPQVLAETTLVNTGDSSGIIQLVVPTMILSLVALVARRRRYSKTSR